MGADAVQAELDQLAAKRDELAIPLDAASAVITALDEQIRGDGPDPTLTERKAAHDAFQAAFAPWNEADGQVKQAEQRLAGLTPGPDQGIETLMSGVYDIAKQLMLGSTANRLDLDSTDVIMCRLVDKTTDYTAYAPSNTTMTSIPKYAGTTDQTLTGAIVTNSPTVAFDSTVDPTFTAVAVSGSKTVGGIAIFKFVTNDAGSTPICFIDGFTAVVPNGGNITVTFDSGNNRVFAL